MRQLSNRHQGTICYQAKVEIIHFKGAVKVLNVDSIEFVSTYLCRIYDDLWISNENNI